MPRVPQLNGGVGQAALPGARVSTDAPREAFGGGGVDLGSALEPVSRGLSAIDQVVQAEKRKADDSVTTESWKKMVEHRNKLLYDPKDGVMTKRGKDALGVVDDYGGRFRKGLDEIEKDLSNDDQRQMFRRMRMKEEVEFGEQLQRHTFQESQKFAAETATSAIEVARNDAILNYQRPGKVAESIKMARAQVARLAEAGGHSPEWQEASAAEATSKIHAGVISRMLAAGQDLQASEYYKANKEGVRGEDAIAIEKTLEEGSLRGESQRRSDALLTKHETMADALAAAKGIKDPRVRDAVTTRIKDEFSTRDAARRADGEKRFLDAANVIESTKDPRQVAPDVWATFSVSERNALESRARQLREGIPPVTDWGKYYELKSLASAELTRQQFLQTNLIELRPVMADAELKELIGLQTELRRGDTKTIDGYRTDSQIVNDALNEAGIDPSPKPGSTHAEKVNLFRRQVDERLAQIARQTGKKPSNADVQSVVDDLMVKGVVKGSGLYLPGYQTTIFQKNRRAFELEPGQSLEVRAEDIPRSERGKIEEALRRRGLPVSEDRITELYRLKHGRKPSGAQ